MFRKSFPGLEQQDAAFATEKTSFDELKKGILDKQGDVKDSATNYIVNALNKGNEARLERLKQLIPDIEDRVRTLRIIENFNNSGTKVGAYTRSLSQAARIGGILWGGVTGDVRVFAGALAMDAIANPETAVAMLRAIAKVRPDVIKPTLAYLAKYAVTGSVAQSIGQGAASATPDQGTQEGLDQPTQGSQIEAQPAHRKTPKISSTPQPDTTTEVTRLAQQVGITDSQLKEARKYYKEDEILAYLKHHIFEFL